jgi:hypothetical protein
MTPPPQTYTGVHCPKPSNSPLQLAARIQQSKHINTSITAQRAPGRRLPCSKPQPSQEVACKSPSLHLFQLLLILLLYQMSSQEVHPSHPKLQPTKHTLPPSYHHEAQPAAAAVETEYTKLRRASLSPRNPPSQSRQPAHTHLLTHSRCAAASR